MKLSRQQFENLYQQNKLVISFIGMSNTGKSFWSKKLSDIRFRHDDCDQRIEDLLSPVLKEYGYSGLEGMSEWMGQPYDERFSENQKKYLSLEVEAMKDIFQALESGVTENTIIDTTGSIIHTGKEICEKLNRYSVVIYFEASEAMKEEMFQMYLDMPKPVIFEDLYQPNENESQLESLGRCYKELLDLRSKRYEKYADIIIPFEENNYNMNVEDFISVIQDRHEVL